MKTCIHSIFHFFVIFCKIYLFHIFVKNLFHFFVNFFFKAKTLILNQILTRFNKKKNKKLH